MISKKPPPTPHQAVSAGDVEGVSTLDQGREHKPILKVRHSQGSDDTEQLWTRLHPRDTRAYHIEQEAVTYVDEVKMQFLEMPVVYNEFLDILSDYKTQAIDTIDVITRVCEAFTGYSHLIQGFSRFLPPGYRIEFGLGNSPNSICVSTPSGWTNLEPIQGRPAMAKHHIEICKLLIARSTSLERRSIFA